MDLSQISLLSLVQGLTEFLPISSSAHLILAPLLFGYALQSLAFDVAVHLGTLIAVMLYFRRELLAMSTAMLGRSSKHEAVQARRLGWILVLATLPLLVLGLPLKALLELLREDAQVIAVVIAGTTIGFGLLLWFADRVGRQRSDEYRLDWLGGLLIGCAQTVAIIPGTSRSGITMTAGLLLGLTREAASRFSFLLSIPTILLAGAVETKELISNPAPIDWQALWLGALLSALVAYLTIHFFLKLIERTGMLPFVIYRLFLGGLILVLVL